MENKIITTDEKIARFVALNILSTINQLSGVNNMKPEHLKRLKDEIKKDLKNLDKSYETFENLILTGVNGN
jgi:hypothetical protein